VARFGVLNFIHPVNKYPSNRYAGRLFNRPHHGGHMFVQHYLTKMFGSSPTFLNQRTTNEQLWPSDTAEDPDKIGAGQKTVKELSRFASYLKNRSPDAPQQLASQE